MTKPNPWSPPKPPSGVPNLKNKQTRKQFMSALTWTAANLSTTTPKSLHHDKLREVFSTATHGTSIYLRSHLLIRVGSYSAGRWSYSYLLNRAGYDKLRALCVSHGIDPATLVLPVHDDAEPPRTERPPVVEWDPLQWDDPKWQDSRYREIEWSLA